MHLASIDTEEENKLLQETIADQGLSPKNAATAKTTTTVSCTFVLSLFIRTSPTFWANCFWGTKCSCALFCTNNLHNLVASIFVSACTNWRFWFLFVGIYRPTGTNRPSTAGTTVCIWLPFPASRRMTSWKNTSETQVHSHPSHAQD